MHRLSGADCLFIFNETETCHQHTLKIAVIDPTGADAEVSFAALREQMTEALPLLAPYRWKLARVPLDIGHPYWVDAHNLDLDYHIRSMSLRAPGGSRELAEAISVIGSVGLARQHPLWQIWFVDGLANGHVAYVTKVHHALADGLASEHLLGQVFGEHPLDTPIGDIDVSSDEVGPRPMRLLVLGIVDLASMLARLPMLMARALRGALRVRARGRSGVTPAAKPFRGPHTRFDDRLTANRCLAFETFDLADLKRAGKPTGASVTEVMLAMATGALRTHLESRGELPREPLTATVPVSIRQAHEPQDWGNRVASLYLALPTDVANPVERLRRIIHNARAAKDELDTMGPELQHAWAEYWRLFRVVMFGVPKVVRTFVGKPTFNAIVSSVRGPESARYRHGARLVTVISMGPLIEGIGINFTGWSYDAKMTIAVMTCPDRAGEVWEIVDAMKASLNELIEASSP